MMQSKEENNNSKNYNQMEMVLISVQGTSFIYHTSLSLTYMYNIQFLF